MCALRTQLNARAQLGNAWGTFDMALAHIIQYTWTTPIGRDQNTGGAAWQYSMKPAHTAHTAHDSGDV